MKFNTPYDRDHTPEAPNSGEIITEQQGYISSQDQIESLILAGQRLDESRAAYEFDPDTEVPDDYFDPTTMKNLDLVEAQSFLNQTVQNLQAQKTASEKKPASPVEVPGQPQKTPIAPNDPVDPLNPKS